MEKADTFNENIKMFLGLLKDNTGSNPVFQIDYKKNEINLIASNSAFIKTLIKNGACTHLNNGKLSVNFF